MTDAWISLTLFHVVAMNHLQDLPRGGFLWFGFISGGASWSFYMASPSSSRSLSSPSTGTSYAFSAASATAIPLHRQSKSYLAQLTQARRKNTIMCCFRRMPTPASFCCTPFRLFHPKRWSWLRQRIPLRLSYFVLNVSCIFNNFHYDAHDAN